MDQYPLYIKRIMIQSILRNYRKQKKKGSVVRKNPSLFRTFEFGDLSLYSIAFHHPAMYHLWHVTRIPRLLFYKETSSTEARLIQSALLSKWFHPSILASQFENLFIDPLVATSEEHKLKTRKGGFIWGRVYSKQEETYGLKICIPQSLLSGIDFWADLLDYLFQQDFSPGVYTPSKIFSLDNIHSLGYLKMELHTEEGQINS